MQIAVSLEGNVKEWVVIELQGSLESENRQPKFIGDLHFNKDGVPILLVGHHMLMGKMVKLEKPLAVLKNESNGENVSYSVTAFVTKKLLFTSRPKPLIMPHQS